MFQKQIYEGMDLPFSEMQMIVNFEFGKLKTDLSIFKVYFMTYQGKIYESILFPSNFEFT